MTGMDLAGFEASSGFEEGDRLKAQDTVGLPLLIYVVDRKEGIRSQHSPDGKPGLILDIMNLSNQEVYLSVLWMNNQIVDNLSRYVGKAVAVRLATRKSKNGRDYIVPEALEGQEAETAAAWVTQQPNLFVDARKARDLQTHEEIRGSSVTAIEPGVGTQSGNTVASPPSAPVAQAPAAPAAPPSAPVAPAAQAPATPPSAPAAPTPPAPPAPPAAPAENNLPF